MKIDRQDILLLSFITIIGLFIRISPALSTSFPLNDGGLFYKMILDLQDNHFVLPFFTTYNNAGIPFAYPPLAFYLYAGISVFTHTPVLLLMRFLPAIISALSIPAFFLFAREVSYTKTQAILASCIFSLIPRAFDWLIMGGGVTRSLGLLFALLTMHQAILLFTGPTAKNLFLATLFSGLVILTHPEAAIHSLIACSFIYIWKNHSLTGMKRGSFVAAGAAILSAPWWLTIILRHGIDPFSAVLSSAGQDSDHVLIRLVSLFQFDFTDEQFLTLIAVIALIGMFRLFAKKQPALPIWFSLIQLLEPRGGALYMMIPMSIFAGLTLDQLILPALRITTEQVTNHFKPRSNIEQAFIGFVFLYGILSASIVSTKISQQLTLTSSDLSALQWVQENTSQDSKFAIITKAQPLNDATSEWFPALTERTSLATIFGYEWENAGGFQGRIESYKDLQQCAFLGENCIEEWIAVHEDQTDYIYIHNDSENNLTLLKESLKSLPNYQIVYEAGGTTIFQRMAP